MKKWLARPQFHFQSILDVNCKRKMHCLSILECSEANKKNCKISGNLGDQWSTMQRNPSSSYKSKQMLTSSSYKSKQMLTLNRPAYVGMCILDLSKTLMCDFHYNYIKKKYDNRARLLFTDTDSLTYKIKAEDVYKDF